MLRKTSGIVIRVTKYSESSLIFDLYTEQLGLASFIVGGARKANSKMSASIFQLMNWIEVVAYIKDPHKLSRVKEARPIKHYQQIPFEIQRRSIGMFMTEVIQKSIRTSEANTPLYQYLSDAFDYLDQSVDPVSNLHIMFLLDLSRFLGFYPHGHSASDHQYFDLLKGTFVAHTHPIYTLDLSTSHLLSVCLDHKLTTVHKISMSRTQRQKMIHDLLLFFKLHIERMRDVLTHKILVDVL